jgi:hypothetical protein
VEDYRKKGKLFTSTISGALTTEKDSTKPIQKNTFFGE